MPNSEIRSYVPMIPFPALRSSVRQRGFTLFEIMVTVLLAGLMMTGAFYFLIDFTRSWDQDTADLEAQRQGSHALSVIQNDLRKGIEFQLSDYDDSWKEYTKIEITVQIPDPSNPSGPALTRHVQYYRDTAQDYDPVTREDLTTLEKTYLAPETYKEGGGPTKTKVEVMHLGFTDEPLYDINGNPLTGKIARIVLKIKGKFDDKPTWFTVSQRLRNQDVE